jgi:putative DNA primase/helicase
MANLIGSDNGKNVLIDWLKHTKWDGQPRIDLFLTRGCGCADTELTRKMSRKWLVQAVARAMTPGCKADAVLILQGKQGIGKSKAFRALASNRYFNDSPIDIGDRRAPLQMAKTWIYELSELDSMRKAEASTSKAFLSSSEDTYVRPYGRMAETVKRHTVFCGSTNKEEFLNDPTGSRRFWTVEAGETDSAWIDVFRNQLWAEAVEAFAAGEEWWLTQAEDEYLVESNERFNEQEAWGPLIDAYTKHTQKGQWFTTADVMKYALKLEPKDMNRGTEMRVGDCLRRLGFVKKRVSSADVRAVAWYNNKDADVVVFNSLSRRKA